MVLIKLGLISAILDDSLENEISLMLWYGEDCNNSKGLVKENEVHRKTVHNSNVNVPALQSGGGAV